MSPDEHQLKCCKDLLEAKYLIFIIKSFHVKGILKFDQICIENVLMLH